MASTYLVEIVSEVLRSKKVDLAEVSTIQKELGVLLDSSSYQAIHARVLELEKKYGVDLKEARDFVETIMGQVKWDRPALRMREWEGVVEALKSDLKVGRETTRVIGKNISFEETKEISRALIDYFFRASSREEQIENRFVFPFLVSENLQVEGDIIMRMSNSAENVTLVSVWYETYRQTLEKRFFGEGKTTNVNARHYSEPYYQYRFLDDNKHEYVVFSREDLPNGRVKLKGMRCGVMDDLKLATSSASKSQTYRKLDVVFATEIEQQIHAIDLVKFKEMTWGWTHESMAEMLFGKFRHPVWFEKFIMAWLFSGKVAGFPLHLAILAVPATGKSLLLDNLALRKFKEKEVADGSVNTLAYVVPHYGKVMMDPGLFARSSRICAVDEFFTMLGRNNYAGKDMDSDTGYLTSLLEHKERMGGSGKHESTPVRARAKMILASNPQYKRRDLVQCAATLNQAFMTRLLWYVQTPQHIAFVQSRQADLNDIPMEVAAPSYDPRFIEVYDFLNEGIIEADVKGEVRRIFEKYKVLVPMELQMVYAGRTYHHIRCLIDGIAKVNSIIEQRPTLEVKQSDVDEAEQIFAIVMASWNPNIDLKVVPVNLRKEYLLLSEREAYDFIESNPGCGLFELEKAGFKQPGFIVTKLEDAGLVRASKLGNRWEIFPHWMREQSLVENMTQETL